MKDKTIDAYEKIIAKIEEHQADMKQLQTEERKLADPFISGYNCGIRDGLEAAIAIIKRMKDERNWQIQDALLKKAGVKK
jgi:hypothetical protein